MVSQAHAHAHQMSLTAVCRRAAILTGDVSFVSGLVYCTHPVFAVHSDLAIAEVVKAGVKKIATGACVHVYVLACVCVRACV